MRQPYWKIFLKRFVIALVLVGITYNAWGWSYYHWVATTPFAGMADPISALKILCGLVLVVLYIILLYATWRAKGVAGIGLFLIVAASVVYLIWTTGWIDLANPNAGTLVLQLVFVLLLTLGSTWSILWKRMTGQVAVEDPDTVGEM